MSTERLHIEEAGEGPPIVLLHGLTATHRYVVMGSRLLERSGRRVIAYDARGHGTSLPAPAPQEYGYEQLSADLGSVLTERDTGPAVLVGASMGAHTALRFALEKPELVAGIVCVTPAYEPDAHFDGASLARWDALSDGLRSGGVEGFVAAYGEPDVPAAWRQTLLTVLRQRLAGHEHPGAVADALRAVPRSRPFQRLEQLAEIQCPVVVVADRDEPDPGHPLAVGELYAASIPDARLLVEEPGSSPIAWQGAQLSRIALELSERVRG